jgi:hypothetical protein
MFLRFKRILMNEVDAGSGNGAAPAPTASVEPSQAQGDAITLSKTDLAALVATAAEKAVASAKDSLFAEARRTFTGKQTKTKTDDAPTQTNAPTQIDPFKMRRLDFAMTKTGIAADLTPTQYERAHRDYAAEAPDDAESWIKDYFHGHGKFAPPVTQATAATVTQPVTSTTSQPAKPPVSDRGTPPVSAVPLEEQDIYAMSPGDRDALRRQKGDKWFTDRILDQSKRHTVKLR